RVALTQLPDHCSRTRSLTFFLSLILPRPPSSPLFPYTTLFRSLSAQRSGADRRADDAPGGGGESRRVLGVRRLDERPRQHQRSRSEEHTSELQSQSNLVCRLLLEKKKKTTTQHPAPACLRPLRS